MYRQIDCSLKLTPKKARQTRAHAFLLNFFSLRYFPQIKFRIIMSFRKLCLMPFRKLIRLLPSPDLSDSSYGSKLKERKARIYGESLRKLETRLPAS